MNFTTLMESAARRRNPMAYLPFALRLETPYGINSTNGGANSSWADLLTGSGLTAVQATGSDQPITRYESEASYLEFDGTNDSLLTTINGSDVNSAGTYACLFRPRTGNAAGGLIGGGDNSALLCGTDFGLGKPLAYAPVSPINVPVNEWGSFVATWSGTSATYHVRTPFVTTNASPVTLPSGFTSSGGVLGIGVHNTQLPYAYAKVDMIAALVAKSALSNSDALAVRDYLWNLRPGGQPPMSRKVVGLGDSLTEGYSIGVNNVWLSRLTTNPVNFGNSGWTVHQMESLVASVIAQGGSDVDFVLEGGMNNTTHYGGVYTPAQTWQKIKDILAVVRPYFRRTAIVSITPQNLVTINSNFEADRQTLNGLMRSGVGTYFDTLADLGASGTAMGDAGDNTNVLYFFDGLHYTCRGQLVLRDLIYTALS